jgi:hypothetical protein
VNCREYDPEENSVDLNVVLSVTTAELGLDSIILAEYSETPSKLASKTGVPSMPLRI